MFIDLTIQVPALSGEGENENKPRASFDHLGTHFDVMDKTFPLEYVERKGLVFDVSGVEDRDIDLNDVDLSIVEGGMFVAFYTGFIEKVGYGTKEYGTNHPQLSNAFIDALVERRLSMIGVDFAGIRRSQEHRPKDQYCADRGVFIVENLCNLKSLLGDVRKRFFIAHTYPVKFTGLNGLPCRVVAEV